MIVKTNARINRTLLPLYTKAAQEKVFADEALYGMGCEVLEKENGFAHVRMDYGYEGWVDQTALVDGDWREDLTKVRVIWGVIDVMEQDKVASQILATVTRAGVLALAEEKYNEGIREGWIAVYTADGRLGYTKKSYLVPYHELKWTSQGLDEETFRSEVTEMIRRYEGTHYRWAGRSPLGIDCSGVCSIAYLMCGVVIYRDASIKEGYCVHPITREEMKPGDLLFFEGHVAMYMGGERKMYLHSTAHAGDDGITYNSLIPEDPRYREDLDKGILAIGSIF